MNISEMYIDYLQGMSQRELEKKYDVSFVTITRRCKQISVKLFNDSRFLLKNLDQIKKEVDVISEEIFKCPYCGKDNNFWENKKSRE